MHKIEIGDFIIPFNEYDDLTIGKKYEVLSISDFTGGPIIEYDDMIVASVNINYLSFKLVKRV